MMCLCALDVCTDWVSGGGGRGGSGGNAMGVALGVSGFEVFVVGQEGGVQDTGVRLNYIHTLVPGSGSGGCWVLYPPSH